MILPRLGNFKTMKGISILGVCALAIIGLVGFRGFNPELEPQDMLGKTDSELEAMLDPLARDLAMDQSRRALREYRASKGLFSCEGDCVDNQRRYLQAEQVFLSLQQKLANARIARRVRKRARKAAAKAAHKAVQEARRAERTHNGFNLLGSQERNTERKEERKEENTLLIGDPLITEERNAARKEARKEENANNLSSEERNAARKAARKEEQAVLSRAHWAEKARLEEEAAQLAA